MSEHETPAEDTGEKQKRGRPFGAGESGNPAGRPKGSRNKLGEAFITALHADFEKHGAKTIARVRDEDPTAYVKVCASLLPKELKVSRTDEMTDDELEHRIRQLADAFDLELGSAAGTRVIARGEGAPHRPN